MGSFVYVLTNPSMPGLVKVGKTTTSPGQRMAELHTTGVPTAFELEFCAEVAYFGPSWTLVSVRAGHARRLDFDTVLGRSGQLRFGHLDDAGPPSRRDVVKFKACLLVGRPARRGSNLI